MSYPISMFLEQMAWSLENLQRCVLDQITPLHVLTCWEKRYKRMENELFKYLDEEEELRR
jgi:hypothetical protein